MAEKKAPNKSLLIGGAAVLLAAGGWFVWQQFMEEPPPPPPPPPKAVAKPAPPAVNQDKLIEEILVVSGLDGTLQRLPEKMLSSVRQSGQQDKSGKLTAADLREMERLTQEAFSTQGFRQRVTARLKKNFDAKRYQEFLADSATPLAKRMTELEKQEPKPEELVAYMKGLAARPLAPERMRLVERIDTAGRASELAQEAMFSTIKGMMRGFAGSDTKQLSEVEKLIEKQRAAAAENIRNAVRLSLAYTYRDVSDADLAEYAKLHEKDSTRFMLSQVYEAMIEEIRDGAERFGAGLEKIVKAKMAAQAAAGSKGRPKVAAPAAASGASGSRVHEDARDCLRFDENRQVMDCAERYR
jgi:hypothetical protein